MVKKRFKLSRKRFPQINIESYLISWGLLSSSINYSESKYLKLRKLRNILLQRFQLIFLWFLSFKLILCCFLRVDSRFRFYLGDASGFMGGPRTELATIFALWTLNGALIAFVFLINSKNKFMSKWLKIFEICESKNVDLSEHNFDEEMALKFHRRVHYTLILLRFIVYGSMIAAPPCFLWVYATRWPQTYNYSIWTLVWSLIAGLWIYRCQQTIQASLMLFHQICYYIKLKLQKLHEDFRRLSEEIDLNKLSTLLKDHNEICELIFECNKFWKIFISTNFGIVGPLILLSVHISIFSTNVLPVVRIAYFFMASTHILYATVTVLSASQVEHWVSFINSLHIVFYNHFLKISIYLKSYKSYNILNSIFQNGIPVSLSIKLSNSIQRIAERNIGFSVHDINTISYKKYFDVSFFLSNQSNHYFVFFAKTWNSRSNLFQVILTASTYFLLILDLNLS